MLPLNSDESITDQCWHESQCLGDFFALLGYRRNEIVDYSRARRRYEKSSHPIEESLQMVRRTHLKEALYAEKRKAVEA